jgi:hypothetical protein
MYCSFFLIFCLLHYLLINLWAKFIKLQYEYIQWMTYNALKSIDLTTFVNVLMCFLVNCSNGGGQVSPVRTRAFHRMLLSFSSWVQFKSMWLIVCSSLSLQGRVEVVIILNLWRYGLVKPWPVTMGRVSNCTRMSTAVIERMQKTCYWWHA